MTRFTLLFIPLLFPLFSLAKLDFNSNCQKAYDHIVKFEWKQAKQLLAQEPKSNVVVPYLRSLDALLRVYISEDKKKFEQFLSLSDSTLDAVDDLDLKGPYALLLQGELHLFRAVIKLKFQERWSAAISVVKGKSYFDDLEEEYPHFLPSKLCLGVMHAFIGAVPNQYQPYLSMLGFEGNIEQGLAELKKVQQSDYHHLKHISALLHAFLSNELGYAEVIELEQEGVQLDGVLSPVYQAMVWGQYGRGDDVVKLLEPRMDFFRQQNMFFPFYLMGRAKLNQLDPKADVYLLQFLQNYKGSNYRKSGHELLAMHYQIHGPESSFHFHREKIKTVGEEFVGADERAMQRYERWPSTEWLRIQLLSDGGNYKQAQKELQLLNYATLKPDAQQEYLYRTFILKLQLEQTKDLDQALEELLKQPYREFYYQANACYKYGYWHEKQGRTAHAVSWYNRALDFKDYPYETSISQKAKAGLLRLE